MTLPLSAADLLGELFHVLKDLVNSLDNALSVNGHGLVAGVTEGNVVNGAVLGEVDWLSGEHCIAKTLNIGGLSELGEQADGLVVDNVLGEVEEDLDIVGLEGPGKLVEARGVLLEEIGENKVLSVAVVVGLEGLPLVQFGGLGE